MQIVNVFSPITSIKWLFIDKIEKACKIKIFWTIHFKCKSRNMYMHFLWQYFSYQDVGHCTRKMIPTMMSIIIWLHLFLQFADSEVKCLFQSIVAHLSTAVAWREKKFKHFVFYKYFSLVLGLLKSRISEKTIETFKLTALFCLASLVYTNNILCSCHGN